MGTRIATLAFVGSQATFTFNTYKVNPENPSGPSIPTQARREYLGENSAAAARTAALKFVGKAAEHCVAVEVAPGMYSIELPSPDDAAPAKPGKK